MIERVIIHIGAAKCGSTSIQNTLDSDRENLISQGFLFPRSVLSRRNLADLNRTPGHADLLSEERGISLKKLTDEIAKIEECIHTLILSIENIYHGAGFKRLKDMCINFNGSEIILIGVFRDQISWINSFYYEAVVGGIRVETRKIEEFCSSSFLLKNLEYLSKINYINSIICPKKQIVLSLESKHESLESRFANSCGLNLSNKAIKKKMHNVSYRYPECIEAHRLLNKFLIYESKEKRQIFAEKMKDIYMILNEENLLTNNTSLMSIDLKRSIQKKTYQSNLLLNKIYKLCTPIEIEINQNNIYKTLNEGIVECIYKEGVNLLKKM